MSEGINVPEGGGEEQVPGARSSTLDVFISYASPDSAVAEAACEALERAGVTCWIAPRDVTPGAFYADEIVHAIDNAKAVVLILSKNAVVSPHVLREVERAASKRHPVVSLRIDQAPLPAGLEYFLNTSQWLDASAGDTVRALPKLVAAVGLAIEKTATRDFDNAATPAKGTSARSSDRAGHGRSRHRAAIVAGCLVALAVSGFAAYRSWQSTRLAVAPPALSVAASAPVSEPKASTITEKSVAVLPFVDMSEKKDQEYFSDGLSEELIDLLSKVPELKVTARTSSFFFKGRQSRIGDIAKELGVANVLEGSVRKSGKHLRITAQLIRADTGFHLWSETYDRTLDDIFKVQEEIAGAVVKAMKVSLIEGRLPHASMMTNSDAYALMLQARFLVRQLNGPDELKKAAHYYEESLRIDPTASTAWAGLSRALITLWSYDQGQQQYLQRATQAAERALALDARSSDAHVALGKIRFWSDWDWRGADSEFRQARALDPTDSYVSYFSGELACSLGQLPAALEFYRRALDQDPLNLWALLSVARVYEASGRTADALTVRRKLMELNPSRYRMNANLGVAELRAGGDENSALARITSDPDTKQRLWGLAWAYATLGRTTDSDRAIARYEQEYGEQSPFALAELYATRGEADRAFAWLDRAYQQREFQLVYVNRSAPLSSLRGDARFGALLRKMNLPL